MEIDLVAEFWKKWKVCLINFNVSPFVVEIFSSSTGH